MIINNIFLVIKINSINDQIIMGIFDSLKEKYEISKEKLNTKYDSVKREETEKLEKIIEKSNA